MTASVGFEAFLFDLGWGEMIVIGVVALIAFGPKELPTVLRTVGQWMAKIRRMAAEFQGQFQEAMREAELADLKQQFDTIQEAAKDIGSLDPVGTIGKEIESATQPPNTASVPKTEGPVAPAETPAASPPATPVDAPASAATAADPKSPTQPENLPRPGDTEAGKGQAG